MILRARSCSKSPSYLEGKIRMVLMGSTFPRAAEACIQTEQYSPSVLVLHSSGWESRVVLSEVPLRQSLVLQSLLGAWI